MNIVRSENIRQAEEFIEASRITKMLSGWYPGYKWMCAVDSVGGVIKMREGNLMKEELVYVVRLPEVNTEKKLRKMVYQGGGEILERFGLSRDSANLDALAGKERDFQGNVLFDSHGVPNWIGEKTTNSFTKREHL